MNSQPFSFRSFGLILLLFILVEALSFLGYFLSWVNLFGFLLISLLTLVVSLIKVEYGLYILLAELFIGSKGYLFHFDLPGFSISIRIALFLIIVSVWLLRVIQGKFSVNFLKSKNLFAYSLLFIVLLYGFINGIISKYPFDKLFFDFNNWLYFALVFVFFDAIQSFEIIKKIFHIFLAGLSNLFLKTVFSFWLFSRTGLIKYLSLDFYKWLRTTLVAEVAKISENFYRIFIQSQIYCLVGFFLGLALLIYFLKKERQKKRGLFLSLMFIFISSFPLLISFSRSFWLSFLIAFIIFILVLKIKKYVSSLDLFKIFGFLSLILVLEILFIFLLNWSAVNLSTTIEQRVSLSEPAALSRWQQFGPLSRAVIQRPIFGFGFGKTITFQTADPRAIERLEGQYTTYVFEWGYLDIILKVGLVGLLIYLFLIWKIWQQGWQIVISNFKFQFLNFLVIGLLFGLLAIVITHLTSPYLNHPLGIGYLILISAIFENLRNYESLPASSTSQGGRNYEK